jgi:hypothetical protein
MMVDPVAEVVRLRALVLKLWRAVIALLVVGTITWIALLMEMLK